MKQLFLNKPLLAAITFLCIFSQQISAQSVDRNLQLNNAIDSLSYMIGIAQSNGLKEYISERLDVDTAYMQDFTKGLVDAAQNSNNPAADAYFAGIQIGQQLVGHTIKGINSELFGDDEKKSISLSHFLSGFIVGINNNSNVDLIAEASDLTHELMERIKEMYLTPEQKAYKKKNEDWLATNITKPGIHTLPSGVQYKVIRKGTGSKPLEESEVVCHYEGRLIDGTVFDSSYKRGKPNTFRANQVIQGWTDALISMPAGSIWEVYIPQDLAYGNRTQDLIPAFSTLVFKVELISVKR